jgi:type IV pilus assembly protein PilE
MEHEMKQQPVTARRLHQRGMSLMELMIVVAIVALLGTIAVSSYRSQMLRANRVDGTSALLQVQVAQEKFFLQNRRYAADNTELAAAPPGGLGIAVTTPGGHYSLVLQAPTATTYTIAATPAGAQVDDTACPAYSVDEQGTRTPANTTGCWR